MPRDESRDIAIECGWLKLVFESSVYPTMVPVIPPAPGAQCETYVRYVPFSQYEDAIAALKLCVRDLDNWGVDTQEALAKVGVTM